MTRGDDRGTTEVGSTRSPSPSPSDELPDSNIYGLYKLVSGSTSGAVAALGSLAGAIADVGGVVGVVGSIIALINPPPDLAAQLQTDFSSMESTLNQIQNQLGAAELEIKRQTIDGLMAPALGAQESLPDLVAAADQTRWDDAIEACVSFAAYFTEPDAWLVPSGALLPYYDHWSGTLGQSPNPDGLVFCTLYTFSQYLHALTILISLLSAAPSGVAHNQGPLAAHRDNLRLYHDQLLDGFQTISLPTQWKEVVATNPHAQAGWVSLIPVDGQPPPWPNADPGPSAPFGALDIQSYSDTVSEYLIPQLNAFDHGIQANFATYLRVLAVRTQERLKGLYVATGLPMARVLINTLAALTLRPTPVMPIYEAWSAADVFSALGLSPTSPLRFAELDTLLGHLPPYDIPRNGIRWPVPAGNPLGQVVTETERLHILALCDGLVFHTVCTADGKPQPQGVSEVKALTETAPRGTYLSTSFADGALHVLQQAPGLWHTVRYPDGTWQSAPVDFSQLVTGPVDFGGPVALAVGGTATSLHLVGPQTDQMTFVYTVRPLYVPPMLHLLSFPSVWPATAGEIAWCDAVVETDGRTLHCVALDANGGLFHTVAWQGGASQQEFGDVAVQSPAPGPITRCACATVGDTLHVVGLSGTKIYHTLRSPDGSWQAEMNLVAPAGSPPIPGFSAVTCVGGATDLFVVGASGQDIYVAAFAGGDGSWTPFSMVGTAPAAVQELSCANAQAGL